MDAKSPLNSCLAYTIFSLPRRTPIPGQPQDIPASLQPSAITESTTTRPVTQLPETTATAELIDRDELDVDKVNVLENILDDNSLQVQKQTPHCSGDHCHQVPRFFFAFRDK